MKKIYLVPEVNFWMIRILGNSPVGDTFHKIPSKMSAYWRENNSVIELMFNENFRPDPWSSSSSSSSGDGSGNTKPYIYLYRSCNLNLIPDKNVLYRLQTYRWFATVYAANSQKFIDIFDETGAHYPPAENNSDVIFDSGLDYLDAASDNVPMLPVDVNEKDRSPYISYETKNLTTTNNPLVKFGAQTITPWPPTPPYPPPYNVFNFTDDDLRMLDMLYDYKVCGICDLSKVDFNSLHGCIAKLVYVYLDAFCNNNFTYFDSEEPISSGTDILCTLYEKYVLDLIYQLKARQYGVIYKQSDVINNQIVEENMYQFMIMKKMNARITLTDSMIQRQEVLITDEIPWDKKDFILYKDGVILEADVDYNLVLDFSNPVNVVAKVVFLKGIYLPGENLEFIWSYVDPESAYSDDEGRVINATFNNGSDIDTEGRTI